MKRFVYTLTLFLIQTIGHTQTELRGIITYQNTNDRISAIQVLARGATPTITKSAANSEGVFKLIFPNKAPGEIVHLEIQSRVYELINHHRELSIILPEPDQQFEARLVVCKKGERDANAVKYYEISTKFIERKYQQLLTDKQNEINQLALVLNSNEKGKALRNKQLYQKEKELEMITAQHEKLLENAWVLAEHFAEIDLAQTDSLYLRAFKLFEEGNITEARAELESEKRIAQLDQLKMLKAEVEQEKAVIRDMENAISFQKDEIAEKEKQIADLEKKEIKNYYLAADLARLQFDFKSGENNLLAALKLDSTDVNILWKLAYLYAQIYDQERSIQYYRKAIQYADNDDARGSLRNNLGNEFANNLQFDSALVYLDSALSLRKNIYKRKPNKRTYKNYLQSYLNLADLHLNRGEINKAEAYLFQGDIPFNKELAAREDLIRIIEMAGRLYHGKGDLKQAETYYKTTVDMRREDQDKGLIFPLINLANVRARLHSFEAADSLFSEAFVLLKEKTLLNPAEYEPVLTALSNKMLAVYFMYNELDKISVLISEIEKVYHKLAEENPRRFRADLARFYQQKAGLYRRKGAFDDALKDYKKAREILEKVLLLSDSPDHKSRLSWILSESAGLLISTDRKNRNEEVIELLKQAEKINQELSHIDNPYYRFADLNQKIELAHYHFSIDRTDTLPKQILENVLQEVVSMPDSTIKGYEVHVVEILSDLGSLFLRMNEDSKAERLYQDLFGRVKKLYSSNKKLYFQHALEVLSSLSLTFAGNHDASLDRWFTEATDLYSVLAALPYVRQESDIYYEGMFLSNCIGHYFIRFSDTDRVSFLHKAQKYIEWFRTLYQNNPGLKELLKEQFEMSEYWAELSDEIKGKRTDGADGTYRYIFYRCAKRMLSLNKLEGFQEQLLALDTLHLALRELFESYPDSLDLKKMLGYLNVSKAFYHAGLANYNQASLSTIKAVLMEPRIINEAQTNLVLSFLLKGEIEAARLLYFQIKDSTSMDGRRFPDIFLEDIDSLKSQGIKSPHFHRLEAWIKEDSSSNKEISSLDQAIQKYCRRDFYGAIEIFRKLALEDNAESYYYLGRISRTGEGTPQNYTLAETYYRKAIALGNQKAYYGLGVLFLLGQGVDKDTAYAREMFNSALQEIDTNEIIRQLNPIWLSNLSFCLERGLGIEKDLLKSFHFLQLAAYSNYPRALYSLGLKYYYITSDPKDKKLGFYLLTKSANYGFLNGQARLAKLLMDGKNFIQDTTLAFQWYLKAAENNHTEAQLAVGKMYNSGQGAPQNYKKGFYWLSKAGENNNASALNRLGIMHEDGKGVEKDMVKAELFYQKAASLNSPYAKFNLGLIYYYGKGTEINYNTALNWFLKSAAQNHVRSMEKVIAIYETKIIDLSQASFWKKKLIALKEKK